MSSQHKDTEAYLNHIIRLKQFHKNRQSKRDIEKQLKSTVNLFLEQLIKEHIEYYKGTFRYMPTSIHYDNVNKDNNVIFYL